MVVEADKNGVLDEVLVLAAALSIQDPRERPADKQQAAAELHARFTDETSDFLAYLNLWRYLRDAQRELGSSAFRRRCKAEHLNHLRIREWQDVYHQLRQVTRTLGMSTGAQHEDGVVDSDKLHQSLLAGLLTHVGMRDADKRDYVGARAARFSIVPGSALFKKTPRWVVAAELVETNRLWGRVVGRVQPEWVEALADHLVVRSYAEPHWERKQAAVIAYERVTLYGLPLVARRPVNYGKIDPETSRDLFLRHALVEGDWDTHHAFFADNTRLLEDVEELEHRARRRDIVVDDETLYAFYDERVPADVVSGRHFDAWWKKARHDDPDLLTFTMAMLVARQRVGGPRRLPGHLGAGRAAAAADVLVRAPRGTGVADGVTVHVPLHLLNQVSPAGFDWQVPGLRAELVTARHQGAAQADARAAGARARHRPRAARAARAAPGRPADGAVARGAPPARGRPRAGGRRLVARAGAPADHLPRVLGRPDAGPGQGPAGAAARRSRRGCRRRCPRPPPGSSGPACAAGTSATCRPSCSPARCAASRRSSTRATRWRCGCSGRPPSATPPTAGACGACCCCRCRRRSRACSTG